jgi:transposase InsO family protein
MAQKVAAMDVRMAASLAEGPANVAEFCRSAGISRTAFYKWRARFQAGGVQGLLDRSRRPLTSPGATPLMIEDAVVRWRKELQNKGCDCGPQSIRWKLEKDPQFPDPAALPSRATIARILSRRGLVTPQPRKRPRSSYRRFTYPRPNECWQSDWTEWALADKSPVAIAGTLDDHSRYMCGLRAAPGDGTGALVWQVMTDGIAECGIPMNSLTDNGSTYTARLRGGEADFERNLRALGVQTINSTPHHPQTCGKIERFWQTLKKWLRARDTPTSLAELNDLLEQFRSYYNNERRHRALAHHCTPAEAFAATEKARPVGHPLPAPVRVTNRTVRGSKVGAGGYAINVGRRWDGHQVDIVCDGDHITIFSGTRLVRVLDADPTRFNQPLGRETHRRGTREPLPHQQTVGTNKTRAGKKVNYARRSS